MRVINILGAVVVFSCLASCAPVYQTTYQYVPPHSSRGVACINRCLQHKSSCNSRCSRQKLACHADADYAAKPAFKDYIKQQRKNKLPINKDISDFANYSSCDSDCACSNDYRQCYTNCGGHVIPHTQCVAFCKKPA